MIYVDSRVCKLTRKVLDVNIKQANKIITWEHAVRFVMKSIERNKDEDMQKYFSATSVQKVC